MEKQLKSMLELNPYFKVIDALNENTKLGQFDDTCDYVFRVNFDIPRGNPKILLLLTDDLSKLEVYDFVYDSELNIWYQILPETNLSEEKCKQKLHKILISSSKYCSEFVFEDSFLLLFVCQNGEINPQNIYSKDFSLGMATETQILDEEINFNEKPEDLISEINTIFYSKEARILWTLINITFWLCVIYIFGSIITLEPNFLKWKLITTEIGRVVSILITGVIIFGSIKACFKED